MPPAIPLTFHDTAVLELFCTVAVNCLLVLIRTLALVGEMATVTGGGTLTMVTEALPAEVGTARLVACTVTVAGEGTPAGAV